MVPSNWQNKQLSKLFVFQNGINAQKEQYGKGYKFVNVMDVFKNTILTEPKIIGRVEVSLDKIEKYKLKYGDVLFNRTSEVPHEIAIASTYLDNKIALFGGFVIRGRPISNDIAAEYSVFLFQSKNYREQVSKLGQGAVRSNIGQKELGKISVLVPPFEEQKKIAQILSTWDKAITIAEQLLANSQQQKKSLMQQLLTGKKRLLDENGVRFSEQWNYTEIKELLRESRITSNNSDPSKRLTVKLNLKGIEIRKCRGTEAINSTTHFIRKTGQFIYGKQNIHKGALGIIPPELNGFETSQDLPTFDFTEKCESSWFLHFMSQEHFLSSLESKMSGTGSKRLNPKVLLNIRILFPHLKEQQKIAAVLSSADKEITVLQQKLDMLKQEKKALMQQLLTGKRRVKVEEAA
ncbi:restriction endonuclease subunit S [Zymobacter sp. IVIA_5232.4 C2]|uniref:restriction endonuclease subunit S n=1 Tax=Zymobacter sp. IVIA_5232.4 C2 TaxID=3394855 RepID=UPI0039C14AC3